MLKERYKLIDRNITDNLFKDDFLGTQIYAKELYSKIEEYKNSQSDKPLYISLVGTWGSGKTIIVDTALDKFEDDSYLKIKYDAWKYSGDSFRRTFLISLSNDERIKKFGINVQKHIDRLYKDKKIEGNSLIENIIMLRDRDFNLSKKQLIFGLIIGFIIITGISIYWIQNSSTDWVKLLGGLGLPITVFGSLSLITKILFKKTELTYPKYFSSEQFYNAVNDILTDDKIKDYVKIIFIDNVDRCDEDDLKQTFASIKGLLEIKEKIIYIIPFDEDAIKRIYTDGYGGYINKMFDTKININICNQNDILDYLYELKNKYPLYDDLLQNEVIEIISMETYRTPREIIDVCNNFITEYNMYLSKNKIESNKIKADQLNFLIKYSIIKNKYPNFYQEVIKDIDRYNEIEEIIVHNSFEKIAEIENELITNKIVNISLYNFLRATRLSQTDDIESYFYMSDAKEFNLSSSIQRKITNELYGEAIEDINKSDNKIKVVKFLSKTLPQDLKNHMWKIKFKTKFLFLIKLVKAKIIDYNEIQFIETIFKNEDFYKVLIEARLIEYNDTIDFMYNDFNTYQKYIDKVLSKLNVISEEIVPKELKRDYINYSFENYPQTEISSNLKDFYIAYSNKIINEDVYQTENRTGIFNSKLIKNLSNEYINKILNNLRIENEIVVNKIINTYEASISDIINPEVFMNLILIINKLAPYDIKFIDSIKSILNIINRYGNEEGYNEFINKIDADFNVINNTDIFKSIYKIYFNFNVNNQSLRNYLKDKRSEEEMKIYMNDIKKTKNCSYDYRTEFYIEYLSKLNEEEYKIYQSNICSFYKNNKDIQSNITDMIYSKSTEICKIIFDGFDEKSEKSAIHNYINGITQKTDIYEKKLQYLFLFEYNNEMINDFIDEVNNLTKLYDIYVALSADKTIIKQKIIRKMKRIIDESGILTIEDKELIDVINNDKSMAKNTKRFLTVGLKEKTNHLSSEDITVQD